MRSPLLTKITFGAGALFTKLNKVGGGVSVWLFFPKGQKDSSGNGELRPRRKALRCWRCVMGKASREKDKPWEFCGGQARPSTLVQLYTLQPYRKAKEEGWIAWVFYTANEVTVA